ncbi:MAG: formate dehydrogenase accessory sulfurtransferase FdhD, partial [Verrucomicrobia bacterium]|nr:formate dehydrogenase accessory sulfurtransferase FdhD [Verrucomicrobiota bacterium]
IYLCADVYEKRSLLASSSCGMCGQREFDQTDLDYPPLVIDSPLEMDKVAGLMTSMRQAQRTFDQTGSTHAAAVFDMTGNLICLFEDIGRHNAVDKAVGFLLENDDISQSHILAVSGRVSFEIVTKAYRANLPFILAVSAPSSFAVDMSQRWGMSVLGFCREGRATVYSNSENVKV